MSRLTNQIVFVCSFLTNFLPALSQSNQEKDVEKYFKELPGGTDNESGLDMDSDSSSD